MGKIEIIRKFRLVARLSGTPVNTGNQPINDEIVGFSDTIRPNSTKIGVCDLHDPYFRLL